MNEPQQENAMNPAHPTPLVHGEAADEYEIESGENEGFGLRALVVRKRRAVARRAAAASGMRGKTTKKASTRDR